MPAGDDDDQWVVLGDELAAELRSVTLEEFRLTEARYETDTRLGRELLYLMSNTEWTRRTTEVVDISRVSAAETRMTVDIDTSYVAHEALRSVDGPLWLPLFTLPSAVPDADLPPGAAAAGPPEPPIGVDITDAQGVRVFGAPQAEVRRHLAAALAETLVARLARRTEKPAESIEPLRYGREHGVLLAAMLGQLLTRPPEDVRPGDGDAATAAPLDDGTRLGRARGDLRRWLDSDRALLLRRPRDGSAGPGSVLASREAEIVQALRGSTFVVVPVRPGPPTSYTMVTPSRPLYPSTRRAGTSAARVRIAVLAPTTHADRVVEVLLPDGVRLRAEGSRSSAEAVIAVAPPSQFEQLRTLLRWILDPSTEGWPRKQLAELAGTKLESAVQGLQHHYISYPPASHPPGDDPAAVPTTGAVLAALIGLRAPLSRLATLPQYVPARAPAADPADRPEHWLAVLGELWPPAERLLAGMRLRRRVDRSTTSPGSVRFRASAIDEFTLRSPPTEAYVDLVLESRETQVLGTALAVNRITGLVLGAVAALLLAVPLEANNGSEVLAALLTFFPAIQASRLRQPDATRLAGLLSMWHFTAGLATAVPGLVLAGVLAFASDRVTVEIAAFAAVLGQLGCHLWIRSLQRSTATGARPGPFARRRQPLVLRTVSAPDQRRFDVLRTPWCRSLTGHVLLVGRTAHPYVVVDDSAPDSFARLLAGSQGRVGADPGAPTVRRRVLGALGSRLDLAPAAGRDAVAEPAPGPAANIVGVLRGIALDRSVTFLIFRDPPRQGWETATGDADRRVTPLRLDQGQAAPMEPPDWVLDVMVGFLPDGVGMPDHPLAVVARAAALAGYTVVNVQLPAPPLQGEEARRWLRARIGVPYRRGDSLRGLVRFLRALQEMRHRGIRVHLREVPPTESLDATQTAPEDPFDAPPGSGPGAAKERTGAPVTDRQLLVPVQPDTRWRLVAVCAPPHAGLLSAGLTALAEDGGVVALGGVISGVLNGSLVVFLLCRLAADAAPDQPADEEELSRRLSGHDGLAGRAATVTVLRGVRWLRPAPAPPRALLRVQIHTPDRAGALQDLLRALGEQIGRAAGRAPAPDDADAADAPPEVDVLYTLTPVVDGQAISGRMLVRLPHHPAGPAGWEDVRWTELGRRVAQTMSAGGGTALADAERTLSRSDDTVVDLDLVRRP